MAFGGDFYQFLGNIANPLFNPRLFSLPGQAADGIQLNVFVFQPVAGDNINIFDRNKKFGVIGIKNLQAVMRRPAGRNIFQPLKPADAVFNMHDQFTDAQSRNIGDEIFGGDFFADAAVLSFT